jgi:hypothetical protein
MAALVFSPHGNRPDHHAFHDLQRMHACGTSNLDRAPDIHFSFVEYVSGLPALFPDELDAIPASSKLE